MRFLVLFFALVSLSGCGSNGSYTPASGIYELSQQQQAEIRSVRVYEEDQLAGLVFELVGAVEGRSCGRQAWVLGENVACVEHLRYRAWTLGANGLMNVRYSVEEPTSECEQLIKGTADAIKVTADR
jgi:uncharacterized protein YbjQ (UPF0145 family)